MSLTSELPQLSDILARYEVERNKRLRSDGVAQFADIGKTDKFKHFAADPWIDATNEYISQPPPIKGGERCKVLVTGTGFAAMLFAVRLILEADFKAEDFVFVDTAWGFGGTWYWNRYPGLMCDVESSCYMPLLEETGYVPKHRYSYGPELRQYAELVAAKYGLRERALFGSSVHDARWDDNASEWVFKVTRRKPSSPEEELTLRSDFFLLASGILNRPKLPRLGGLDEFKGHIFHTSRWDYDYTGGSSDEPTLEKLRGKRVGIIGTGATGIQVVPELARWVDQLYVFQRTPSAVDVRGQQKVDADQFRREVACGKGWQRTRRENMAAFLSNEPNLPSENLVNDGWTHFPSFSGLLGTSNAIGLNMETVPGYLEQLHRIDLPRQERVRARAAEIVKDPAVAELLKPWYAGWCKRPCFHDEYLDTFNKSNVTLVDTNGQGVDGMSQNGVLVDGKEYGLDLLILGTGFESFSVGSPAHRAGLTITGRNNLSMDNKWEKMPGTFHGVLTKDYPNLILPGPRQAGATTNVVHSMDVLARHVAFIMREAYKLQADAGNQGKKLILEATQQGEDAWAAEVGSRAFAYVGLPACTPSYISAEGKRAETQEQQMIAIRNASWGTGILDFTRFLEEWEGRGDLAEIEVSFVKTTAEKL
ncbi:hypothetical protein VTL71DRAFT_14041 [Oculimacula yallundae]|uniref:Uncharacterized protein n=1 Tax=Oculimacula yallundae TaxID=86028 RepID=A0ABR4CM33_9HELO